MILAGDIGGTKTRIALFRVHEGAIEAHASETFRSADHRGLEEIVHAFREAHPEPVEHAGFGVAGPVLDGRVETTNLPWIVEAQSLAGLLRLPRAELVNDLHATALGVSALTRDQLACLNAGDARAHGNRAVIAAGTGLGQAGLYWNGRSHAPLASEGGHADFSPTDEQQDRLLAFLRPQFGRVSWERVLSGPGLVNVFRFVRADVHAAPSELESEMARGDAAAAITQAALARTSDTARRALELFVTLYGAQAGNFALTVMATGGVYLGGGIAPKIVAALREPCFLRAFTAKVPHDDLLRKVPVLVILDDRAALFGAVRAALAPPPAESAT